MGNICNFNSACHIRAKICLLNDAFLSMPSSSDPILYLWDPMQCFLDSGCITTLTRIYDKKLIAYTGPVQIERKLRSMQ